MRFMSTTQDHLPRFWLLVLVTGLLFIAPLSNPALAQAGDENGLCLSCHSSEDFKVQFQSGEAVSAFVDPADYKSSIHGAVGTACSACHEGYITYPHPELAAKTYRDYVVQTYPVCVRCHEDKVAQIAGNTHMVSLAAGNPRAAICTDCHGTHNIQKVSEVSVPMDISCGKCHGEIYQKYKESVHGAALIKEGNTDVPTCVDCHGAHEIVGPSNSPFHLYSPQICAKCHGDKELMAKYGINPDVMETYVSDFHGKTVLIFQKMASGQETNNPVCVDCHGVHNILAPGDAQSSVMKENLLHTCQRCHPNATPNFPDSWLSHYSPGPDKARPIFAVKMIYNILIPVLAGSFLLFIFSDYIRQRISLGKGE